MKYTIKRWTQKSVTSPDIATYKTTVTIYSSDYPTVAVTLNGKFNRKEAINRVYHHLLREGRWSPSFLFQVKGL